MPPRARRLVEYESDTDNSVAPFDTAFPLRRNLAVECHFSDEYDSIDEPISSPTVVVQIPSRAKAKPTPTKAKPAKAPQLRDMKSSDSGVEPAPVGECAKAKTRKTKTILISDDEVESPLAKRQRTSSNTAKKRKQASTLTQDEEGEVAPARRKRIAAQQAEPLVPVKRQRATMIQEEEVMVPAKRKRAAAAAPEGEPVSKKSKTSKTSTKLSSTPLSKARRGAANLPPKNLVTFTPSGPSPFEVPALVLRQGSVNRAVKNALSGITEALKAVAKAHCLVPPPAFLP
ncbi:hypothetical protein MMC07_009921, partial [Pseudocyphellaria aurata]|nr:hypothetical protein [Pseudocyphellaria aurata]